MATPKDKLFRDQLKHLLEQYIDELPVSDLAFGLAFELNMLKVLVHPEDRLKFDAHVMNIITTDTETIARH
jgi:hypothetical protein